MRLAAHDRDALAVISNAVSGERTSTPSMITSSISQSGRAFWVGAYCAGSDTRIPP